MQLNPENTTIRKIKQSLKNITPFGGLNFIYNALKKSECDVFINQKLGFRNFRACYSYSDVVFSLLGNTVCNAGYVSDLEYLKNKIIGIGV